MWSDASIGSARLASSLKVRITTSMAGVVALGHAVEFYQRNEHGLDLAAVDLRGELVEHMLTVTPFAACSANLSGGNSGWFREAGPRLLSGDPVMLTGGDEAPLDLADMSNAKRLLDCGADDGGRRAHCDAFAMRQGLSSDPATCWRKTRECSAFKQPYHLL